MESKTDFRRPIVIKILQKGVSEEDNMRFQMEKELLERVQGHPNIVELFASRSASRDRETAARRRTSSRATCASASSACSTT